MTSSADSGVDSVSMLIVGISPGFCSSKNLEIDEALIDFCFYARVIIILSFIIRVAR